MTALVDGLRRLRPRRLGDRGRRRIGAYAAWLAAPGARSAEQVPAGASAAGATRDDSTTSTTPAPATASTSAADPARPLAPHRPGDGVRAGRRRAARCVWLVLVAVVAGIGFVVSRASATPRSTSATPTRPSPSATSSAPGASALQGIVQRRRRAGRRAPSTLHGRVQRRDVPVVHRRRPARAVPARHPRRARGPLRRGGDTFASDRILVKHTEEYEAENPDRIVDADDGVEDGRRRVTR